MSSSEFSRRKSLTYLACAAIIGFAISPAAQAATGSLINIADPTTAANVAHVTPGGRLYTTSTVSGTVSNIQGGTPYEDACSGSSNGYAYIECALKPVPAGKTLVIQSISTQSSMTWGNTLTECYLDYTGAGSGTIAATYGIPTPFQGGSSGMGTASNAGSVATTLYVKGGTAPALWIYLDNTDTSADGTVRISGYLY